MDRLSYSSFFPGRTQGAFAVMDAGAHGPDCYTGDPRDVLVTHFFKEPQDQGLAMFRADMLQAVPQLFGFDRGHLVVRAFERFEIYFLERLHRQFATAVLPVNPVTRDAES